MKILSNNYVENKDFFTQERIRQIFKARAERVGDACSIKGDCFKSVCSVPIKIGDNIIDVHTNDGKIFLINRKEPDLEFDNIDEAIVYFMEKDPWNVSSYTQNLMDERFHPKKKIVWKSECDDVDNQLKAIDIQTIKKFESNPSSDCKEENLKKLLELSIELEMYEVSEIIKNKIG